ncbi:MAG: LysR family transcriptional regulator [Limnohabitans sp.]|jgi:DNA-binding transcriptional LysR family regulator
MNINDIDLNLLRLFDMVWRYRHVSEAAQRLGLSQPAASQGLARLRRLLGDALFERSSTGVRPTPLAERLAPTVQAALTMLEQALNDSAVFEPRQSQRRWRLHLSDIGEARFLPDLVRRLAIEGPGMQIEAQPLAHRHIGAALQGGQLDLAIGFLPDVADTLQQPLLCDRYVVLLRKGHEVAQRWRTNPCPEVLSQLEFAAVRTHSDTLRILERMQWQQRLRLTVSHFLSLPGIVGSSDLAVLMPRNFARGFVTSQTLEMLEPDLPWLDFTVSMHWSRRFDKEPGLQWLRAEVIKLFCTSPSDASHDFNSSLFE